MPKLEPYSKKLEYSYALGVFPALKSVVKQVDPHAFMIVTKSSEVFGKGYENFNTERL